MITENLIPNVYFDFNRVFVEQNKITINCNLFVVDNAIPSRRKWRGGKFEDNLIINVLALRETPAIISAANLEKNPITISSLVNGEASIPDKHPALMTKRVIDFHSSDRETIPHIDGGKIIYKYTIDYKIDIPESEDINNVSTDLSIFAFISMDLDSISDVLKCIQ